MSGQKNILMLAVHDRIEALRMATGLTLLDDPVRVAVYGELEASAAAQEQLEALDFAEVPIDTIDSAASDSLLIDWLMDSEVVFLI
ncbi:MAG: hypothetical protein P8178_12990 [Candidatus Thiodiazotropha sp.]